jgi:HD-GYP domain-containing protein (c-di-GMP phosphodiesterase class II)
MSMDEIKMLETHPTRGAEILSRLSTVPTDVLQIALQHHERDLGTGYPSGVKKGKTHPLARLVGVADEFCYWVIKGPDSPGIPPLEAVERITMLNGNTIDPLFLQALRKIFKLPTVPI